MSAGIVVAGMTPQEEKALERLATSLDNALYNENIEELEKESGRLRPDGMTCFSHRFRFTRQLNPGG